MSFQRPKPWIRHPRLDRVELWFPYDRVLRDELKALIPAEHRAWSDGEYGGASACWIIIGPRYCQLAENWFWRRCGQGKEIANGQTEMTL